MSLWDKWEREKLEKQGLKPDRRSNDRIHDTSDQLDPRKQLVLIASAFVLCILVVFGGLALSSYFVGDRWSNTYIVRLFGERQKQRTEISRHTPPR